MNYLKNLFQRNQPGIGIELGPERINIAEIRQKSKIEEIAGELLTEHGVDSAWQVTQARRLMAR